MPNQRRTTVRRAPVQSRRRSTSRSQSWFSILALLTVVAMLIGAVGSAVVLDLFSDDDGIEVNPDIGIGDEDETEQLYRDDYRARPDDPDTIATLANHISLTGKVDEAIDLYERALEIAPDRSDLRLEFAQVLQDNGSLRDAELQIQRVVDSQADTQTRNTALLELARLYRDWSPPRTDEAIAQYQGVVVSGVDSITVQIAREELVELGVGTPVASPAAPAPATPAP